MTLSVHGQDTGAFFPSRHAPARHPKPDTPRAAGISSPRSPKTHDAPAAEKTRLPQHAAPAPHAGTDAPMSVKSVPANDTLRRRAAATPAGSPLTPPPVTSALPSFADSTFTGVTQLTGYLLTHNSLLAHTGKPQPDIAIIRPGASQSARARSDLFYVVAGVLFLLALIRTTFSKYFSDLLRAFFNPTLSQRQLREQLSQTPFPALLLNLFFSLSSGLYLFLILRHAQYITVAQPLVLIPVFMGLIMVVYLVKYAFLRFTGWLFNYPEVTSGYVFTLYMVNKVLGVALLPFILVVAFSAPEIASVALDISVIFIILLFVYRYVRSYALVKNQIFFTKFQFFIYLCGFEIAPVLIIGKVVLLWLNGA